MSIKALTFGFMYLMSRAGGMVIPLFLYTNYYPIILGGLSVSCGYFMGKLPETLGKKLLDDAGTGSIRDNMRGVSDSRIIPVYEGSSEDNSKE